MAAEHLQRILSKKDMTVDLLRCEEALRKKFIRNFRERIDVSAVAEAVGVLANEVVDTATRLMELCRQLDGVIVAGAAVRSCTDDPSIAAVCPRIPHVGVRAQTPGRS